jgi:hypothetical protein
MLTPTITIKQYRNVKNITIKPQPGKDIVIRGRHATGKTAVLQALTEIQSVLRSGSRKEPISFTVRYGAAEYSYCGGYSRDTEVLTLDGKPIDLSEAGLGSFGGFCLDFEDEFCCSYNSGEAHKLFKASKLLQDAGLVNADALVDFSTYRVHSIGTAARSPEFGSLLSDNDFTTKLKSLVPTYIDKPTDCFCSPQMLFGNGDTKWNISNLSSLEANAVGCLYSVANSKNYSFVTADTDTIFPEFRWDLPFESTLIRAELTGDATLTVSYEPQIFG